MDHRREPRRPRSALTWRRIIAAWYGALRVAQRPLPIATPAPLIWSIHGSRQLA